MPKANTTLKFTPPADLPTLVETFIEQREVRASAEKIEKVCREALLTRVGEGRPQPNGAVVFNGGMTTSQEVVMTPRVSRTMNEQKARTVLDERGLTDHCVTVERVVTDEAALLALLDRVQERLLQLGEDTLAGELESAMVTAIDSRETLDESKIEGFVQSGKLSLDEVAAMFDEKTTYVLTVEPVQLRPLALSTINIPAP